jgi:hypothetical protein
MSGPAQLYRFKDPSGNPQIPDLSVRFESESLLNKEVTDREGITTYDSVLVAYVAPVGQPKSEASVEIERTLPDGTVKQNRAALAKYAEQLKHYRAGTEAEALGTPLRDIPGMSPGMVQNMKARGIHTAEALASVTDGATSGVMGMWEWREKARKLIEAREKDAPFKQIAAQLEERDATIASLQRQLSELAAAVNAPEKRGPGRPRKDQAEAA